MMDEDLGSSSSSSISVTTESLDGDSYDELCQERQVMEEVGGAEATVLLGSPPDTVTPQEHLSHSTSLGAVVQLNLKKRMLKGIAKFARIQESSQDKSSQSSRGKIVGQAERQEFETNKNTSISSQNQ
jgi:hypothetical protein